jgi:hypothetical protein
VAVVVDVVHNRGAIRIYDKKDGSSGEPIDGVGIESAGNVVIVPWDSDWWLRVSGSLQVGYIVERS